VICVPFRLIIVMIGLQDDPIPVFDTDFEEKALVANLNRGSGNLVYLTYPSPASLRHLYYETKITGIVYCQTTATTNNSSKNDIIYKIKK